MVLAKIRWATIHSKLAGLCMALTVVIIVGVSHITMTGGEKVGRHVNHWVPLPSQVTSHLVVNPVKRLRIRVAKAAQRFQLCILM